MDFVFSGDAPIGSECRRVLLGEAEGAMARLAVFGGGPDLSIHEVRRHNKRMRGILLLARPVLDSGDLSQANRFVRDGAKRFSEARDALVRQETCEKLLASFGKKRVGPSFEKVREELRRRHDAIMRAEDFSGDVKAATHDFAEAARLIDAWDWDQVTLEIVFSAVVSNYRLGLRNYETARGSRDANECHEWRKRAKYLAFHYQLVAFLDPVEFAARAALAEELASWLGEHHDLVVLEETLADHEGLGIGRNSAQTLLRLSGQRRVELEDAAFERGAIVYFDRPEALHERFAECVAAMA